MTYQHSYTVGLLRPEIARPDNNQYPEAYQNNASQYSYTGTESAEQGPINRNGRNREHYATSNRPHGRQGDPARMRANGPYHRDYAGRQELPHGNRQGWTNPTQEDTGFHHAVSPNIYNCPDGQIRNIPCHTNENRRDGDIDTLSQATDRMNLHHNIQGSSRPTENRVGAGGGEAVQPVAYNGNPQPRYQYHQPLNGAPSTHKTIEREHGHPDRHPIGRPGTASRQRILEVVTSPSTISWDNPFPTFPAVKKSKESVEASKNQKRRAEEVVPRSKAVAYQDHVLRPPATSIKSSQISEAMSSTEKEVQATEGQILSMDRHAYQNHYSDRQPKEASISTDEAETGLFSSGSRTVEETIEAEPSGMRMQSNLETPQCRTMPGAIGRPHLESNKLPVSPISPVWQEQGPTAGYYGPADRPFLSTTEEPSCVDQIQKKQIPASQVSIPRSHETRTHVGLQGSSKTHNSYSEHPGHPGHPGYENQVYQMKERPSIDNRRQDSLSRRLHSDAEHDLHQHNVIFDRDSESNARTERSALNLHSPAELDQVQIPRPRSQERNIPRSRSQPDPGTERPLHDSRSARPGFQLPNAPRAQAPTYPMEGSSAHLYAQGDSPRHAPYTTQGPTVHNDRRVEVANPLPSTRSNNDRGAMNQYHVTSPYVDNRPVYVEPLDSERYVNDDASVRRNPTDSSSFSKISYSSARNAPISPFNANSYPSSIPTSGINNHEQRRIPRGNPGNNWEPLPPPPSLNKGPDALPAHPVPTRTTKSPEQNFHSSSGPRSNANAFAMRPPRGGDARPPPMRNYRNDPSQRPDRIGHTERPVPIRNYEPGDTSASDTTAAVDSQSVQQYAQRQLPSISEQELQRRRQDATINPGNLETQFSFAKALAEATLVVEGADAKSKAREREKYKGEAFRILKKLVSEQFSDATFYLGDCYSQGRLGLNMDAKEAFTLYQSAAKVGHAASAFRVAVCCEMGLEEGGGTKRDLQKAIQWYTRAATLGDTPAMYKVGIIQLKGLLSQPTNPNEAIMWLNKAAQRADPENPHALHELVRVGL